MSRAGRSFCRLVGVVLLLALGGAAPLGAQARERQDRGLQRQLDSLVQGFRGTVGIYVRHLGNGRSAAINPDTVFPTASMIKVPLLCRHFEPKHLWQPAEGAARFKP